MSGKLKYISFTTLAIGGVLLFSTACSKKSAAVPSNPTTTTTTTTPITYVKTDAQFWLTQGDGSALLQRQNMALNFAATTNSNPTITVDTTQTYQTIDGFGFALTGGSATLINGLATTQKMALIKELFAADSNNIGISYLRISIGASDLSSTDFTYDDLGSGQTDNNLQYFSIDHETTDLIPVLKAILAINPNIKILACPWTAPVWMKQNAGDYSGFKGGTLNPTYYDAYARYFVKYIQAMKAQGITIDAITPQNEPLNPNNNPSMVLQPADEANFIANYLGPQFKANNISTKIICYDHNCDRPDYPETVLQNPVANSYTDGSAFHLYAGSITALTTVHDAFPSKNVYFTEQWLGGPGNFSGDLQWHANTLVIGATRNWSRNVLEWNLAADPSYNPHLPGGCSTCMGAITIGASVTRNATYYAIAHASKFVPAGSVRIASNIVGSLQNVAFKTPAGKKVLIVVNTGSGAQNFNINFNGKTISPALNAGAVGTFIW